MANLAWQVTVDGTHAPHPSLIWQVIDGAIAASAPIWQARPAISKPTHSPHRYLESAKRVERKFSGKVQGNFREKFGGTFQM